MGKEFRITGKNSGGVYFTYTRWNEDDAMSVYEICIADGCSGVTVSDMDGKVYANYNKEEPIIIEAVSIQKAIKGHVLFQSGYAAGLKDGQAQASELLAEQYREGHMAGLVRGWEEGEQIGYSQGYRIGRGSRPLATRAQLIEAFAMLSIAVALIVAIVMFEPHL